MNVFVKQPADHRDYRIKYSDWLEDGDSIQSIEYDKEDGIEVTGTEVINGDTALIWIDGGTHNKKYKFSVRATTVGGREKEIDFYVAVFDT